MTKSNQSIQKRPWTAATTGFYALAAVAALIMTVVAIATGYLWAVPFTAFSAYCGVKETKDTWLEGTR